MELTKGVFVIQGRAEMVRNLTFSTTRMSDTCMLLLVTAILPAERGKVELTDQREGRYGTDTLLVLQ